ncbi:MAG: universal stress protein [Cyclobacteriaceae bacterium]
MKTEKVLILTDFSDGVSHLLPYGLALAEQLQAQIWIQHVYYIPPLVAGDVYIPADFLKQYEENIQHEFKRLKKKIPALQAEATRFVLSYGDLVTEMNNLIEQEQINLVIVGNHGGGFLTNVLGSNTIKVIQHASCPVLSVPNEAVFQPFQRIALAIDLKETDSRLLGLMVSFAQAFGGRVDIVHVSKAPVPVDVQKLLHDLDMTLEGVKHELFHIHASDVEQGIEQHLEGNNNDLLVLFPRTHSFFDRLFQKSISRQVAYQKKIPLLSIHPQQK